MNTAVDIHFEKVLDILCVSNSHLSTLKTEVKVDLVNNYNILLSQYQHCHFDFILKLKLNTLKDYSTLYQLLKYDIIFMDYFYYYHGLDVLFQNLKLENLHCLLYYNLPRHVLYHSQLYLLTETLYKEKCIDLKIVICNLLSKLSALNNGNSIVLLLFGFDGNSPTTMAFSEWIQDLK
jgi:hypothetical protein